MRYLIVFVVLSVTLAAQWESDGPNARLRVNGSSAQVADPVGHDLSVPASGSLHVTMTSGLNPGAAVILATSNVDPSGAAIANVPGLGILNLGIAGLPLPSGIILLADGIGRTVNPVLDPAFVTDSGSLAEPKLDVAFGLSPAVVGLRAAIQVVMTDPSLPPFNLDMTQCADVSVSSGSFSTILVGSNGSSEYVFGAGMTFPFHGGTYTSVWIHEDGFVTFGAPSSLPSVSTQLDTRGFIQREPAIAAWLSDFDITVGGATDGVACYETDSSVRIVWGDFNSMPSGRGGIAHTGGVDANRFGITLGLAGGPVSSLQPGEFLIEFNAMSGASGPLYSMGVVGHTPGSISAAIGTVDRDLYRLSSSAPGVAAVEEHVGVVTSATLGWNPAGTRREYNDIRSWQGRSIRFTPISSPVVGSAGYASLAVGTPVDDLVTANLSLFLPASGGSIITLTGKFFGFDTASALGTVIIDPQGAAVPAVVLGVLDSTGSAIRSVAHDPIQLPWRDGEGLVIQTPPLPNAGGPVGQFLDMQLNFASGDVETRIVNAGAFGASVTYRPLASGAVNYVMLGGPARYYGVNYTSFFVSTDGRVTFGSAPDFTVSPSVGAFFSPGAGGPIPTIAALWTNTVPCPSGPMQIQVNENVANGLISISWSNLAWANSGSPIGTVSMVLDATGSVGFFFSQVLAETSGNATVIVGVSDQSPGPNTIGWVSGFTSPAPMNSIVQPLNSSIPISNQVGFVLGAVYDSPAPDLWSL